MKLSTQTEVLAEKLGAEQAVKIIAKAGFDAVDFSMFSMQDSDDPLNSSSYREYAKRIRKTADDCGVYFNQSHAPFPSCKTNDDNYTKVMFDKIVRAMEVSAILGVDIMVVHPTSVSPKENINYNVEFYNRLLPYCKKYGVKVALENMWGVKDGKKIPNVCSTAEDFNRHLDALNRNYFVGCLDLGHCGLVGENAPDMIRCMGHDRIKALHVHDNDNVDDLHLFPFTEKMNWSEITKALADIDYDGAFTFEADNSLKKVPIEFLPTAMEYLCKIGRQLIKMIEASK